MTIISPPENVIAIQTAMGFEQTLAALRTELMAREFRIVAEVDFRRELDSPIGIASSRYQVLVVLHRFSAYQAILSDPNGGLMVPFNVAVYENGTITVVSVLHQPALNQEASLGIRVLGQELNRSMRNVLLHLGTHEQRSGAQVKSTASARR